MTFEEFGKEVFKLGCHVESIERRIFHDNWRVKIEVKIRTPDGCDVCVIGPSFEAVLGKLPDYSATVTVESKGDWDGGYE